MNNCCPSCDSPSIFKTSSVIVFEYGVDTSVMLQTKECVYYTCVDCGINFLDNIGEQAKDDAIENYLKSI
jgi:hypothetical protein